MSDQQGLHLSNLAASLSSVSDLSRLQSYLLWVCCKVAGPQKTKPPWMCPKCCHVWNDGKFSMKLKSSTSPGPRMRKILHKMEKTPERMNRIELSLLKRYQQCSRNTLVLLCHMCKNETAMQFPKKSPEISCPPESEVIEVTQSSKKKRKKDRFAGLNASAVLSATPSPLSIPLKTSTSFKSSSLSQSMISSSASAAASPKIPQTKSSNDSISLTPKTSRPQQSHQKKKGPKSIRQKMNLLREEIKQAEQNRVKEEFKALSMRNLNIRKNNKLQDFLTKNEKDVHLEDRINSLLQF